MFHPGTFIFGVVLPIAVIVLVAYGVWELLRSRTPDVAVAGAAGGVAPASGSARTILDERFARGDLDAEEYVRRRALLDGTVPSPPPEVLTAEAPAVASAAVAETSPADAAPAADDTSPTVD